MDIDLAFRPLAFDPKRRVYQPAEVLNKAGAELPQKMDWRSGVVFSRLGPSWRMIYGRGAEAVMAERTYGKGTIVLATDSSFASNEALREEPRGTLLAWLVGPSRRVIFDETHLYVSETPGLMSLALKYGLHGAIAVAILLALLFIWKNSLPLIPLAGAAAPAGRAETGRDAWAGMTDLLLRNIPRDRVLRVCLDEWRRGRAGKSGAAELEKRMAGEVEYEESQPPSRRDPVAAYRAMAEIAGRKKPK